MIFMKFVADTMLEKLAHWLRILGYDVICDSSKSLKELVDISNSDERVFLTRRKLFPDTIIPVCVFGVSGEKFDMQLKNVIVQFGLDINSKLFSRCVECNVEVEKVDDKETIKNKIPLRSWEGFNEFYKCPSCNKAYWKGAHMTNTMKKLNRILDKKL